MSAEQGASYRRDDKPREECGIVAVKSIDGAVSGLARRAYDTLAGLQHRGEDAAGISVYDSGSDTFMNMKDTGLVTEVFHSGGYADNFPDADIAMAHTRYGTGGKSGHEAELAHPIASKHFKYKLADNGHMYEMEDPDDIKTDTQMLVGAIDERMLRTGDDLRTALLTVLREDVKGAYSLIASDGENLFVARDPWGFRPLCEARFEDGDGKTYHYFASEDSALPYPDLAQEVPPNSFITVHADGSYDNEQIYDGITHKIPKPKLCSLELVYLARSDSTLLGRNVGEVRYRIGEKLAEKEDPDLEIDLVSGVPESGVDMAMGYAVAKGFAYRQAITKNAYIARTFIKKSQTLRQKANRLKIRLNSRLIRDKRFLIGDDSIIRGTVMGDTAMLAREVAGAKEVHVRVAFPPPKFPCIYGIDTGNPDELLANRVPIEDIKDHLGVDSIRFITEQELRDAIESVPICRDDISARLGDVCMACVSGDYPTIGKVTSLPLPRFSK